MVSAHSGCLSFFQACRVEFGDGAVGQREGLGSVNDLSTDIWGNYLEFCQYTCPMGIGSLEAIMPLDCIIIHTPKCSRDLARLSSADRQIAVTAITSLRDRRSREDRVSEDLSNGDPVCSWELAPEIRPRETIQWLEIPLSSGGYIAAYRRVQSNTLLILSLFPSDDLKWGVKKKAHASLGT